MIELSYRSKTMTNFMSRPNPIHEIFSCRPMLLLNISKMSIFHKSLIHYTSDWSIVQVTYHFGKKGDISIFIKLTLITKSLLEALQKKNCLSILHPRPAKHASWPSKASNHPRKFELHHETTLSFSTKPSFYNLCFWSILSLISSLELLYNRDASLDGQ